MRNFAERLANVRVSYRCGLCCYDRKPCHNCRTSSWMANGYLKIYEHSDWRSRVRLQIKQNLTGDKEICIW